MCGIIGYIGQNQAVPVLLDGLKRLEYRGYDSAGLVVLVLASQNSLKAQSIWVKTVGRIHHLEEKSKKVSFVNSRIGLAHTRWATHGGVTEENAHPHSDCQKTIWIVHNGIIENYESLKKELIKKGHRFSSETDSEVLAHLIEQEYQIAEESEQLRLENAVSSALGYLQGTYGLAVVSNKEPHKLVAARLASPLMIGLGEKEFIVASDPNAVLRSTRQVIYLDDNEMAVLTPSDFTILSLPHKEKVKKTSFQIEFEPEKIEKGRYPHFMLKEIYDQPQSLTDALRGRLLIEEGGAKLGGLESVKEKLREIKRLIIVACGTAYHAGLVGEYMLEEYAGIPTEVEYSSEFRYRQPVLDNKIAVVAISQSGETADTLAAVKEAKQKGILTLGIVNVVGSTITRETEAGIYNHAGPEIGVASTKAFSSQLAILALLTLFLGRQNKMSLVMGRRIAKSLIELPLLVKEVLKQDDDIKKMAERYHQNSDFLYLGRKYNFPIALEGALKLKEISYIHAEGMTSGEMKHGSLAIISKEFPSLVIAPTDSVYEKNISNIQEIKAREGKIIAIATAGNEAIKDLVQDVIYIPKTLEMLTPILTVIPLQLFAYYVGVLRGSDVDKPRNLAKSVTVE